jgi:hypothetical protein
MLVVLYDDRRGVGVSHRVIGKWVAADDVWAVQRIDRAAGRLQNPGDGSKRRCL